MINKTTKTTVLYNELNEEDRKKYFDYTRDKYINHIDTFYYAVHLDVKQWGINSNEQEVVNLFHMLKYFKEICNADKKPVEVFPDLYMSPFKHFSIYSYNLGIKDKFDIFIADYLPNKDTPPVFVQLRSASLWQDGTYNAFEQSYKAVKEFFEAFEIKIIKCVENRIDYAYHTNYIQDIANFFPMKKVGQMQVSNFNQGNTHFYIYDEETFTDYFTLGRRTSNNIFFRVYDKTKEVIEMGYKHFFIPIWLEHGLINQFDYEVLTNCAKMGNNWHNIDRCRALFYLEHGSDETIKQKINNLFAGGEDVPATEFSKIIKGVVPKVTTICNLEFQVKRKFFSRLQEICVLTKEEQKKEKIKLVEYLKEKGVLKNQLDSVTMYIYNILGQSKSITNYITQNTLRFVKYKSKKDLEIPRHQRETADFWKRLQSCEPLELSPISRDYCRKYQTDIDKEMILKGTISKMAVYSAYFSFDASDPWGADDVSSDVLNHLNDNDLAEKFLNKSTQKRKELRKYYNLP